MMHQLLKPLLLRLDFNELLKLRIGARSLAIHIVLKCRKRDNVLILFTLLLTFT